MSDLIFLLLFLGGVALLRIAVEGLDRLVGRDGEPELVEVDRR